MSDAQGYAIWTALRRAEERCIAKASAAERELEHALYGYESRLIRLRYAINASGPLACRTLEATLEGIKLDAVWKILYGIVHDIALYYGGSVVAGTAMGAAAGSLAGGVGAAPGAAIGFGAGQLMGAWVMTFLGLKMLAEGLGDTIPQAFRFYWKAFRAAWGPIEGDPHDARYRADFALSEDQAAHHFAQGHVLMIMAILMALVAYLTRGSSEEALMQAVRQSERLGAKMADWLTENKQKLLNHPRLRPMLRPRAEPPTNTVAQALKGRRLPPSPKVDTAATVESPAAKEREVPSEDLVAADRVRITELSKAGKIDEARQILEPHVMNGDYQAVIDRLDVSSAPDTAGFWSGDKAAAMDYANANGKTILETTSGGRVVDGWDLLNQQMPWNNGGEQFWGGLSNTYAKGVSGDIFVIQTPERAMSAEGLTWNGGYVWQNYEKPVVDAYTELGRITSADYMLTPSPNIAAPFH